MNLKFLQETGKKITFQSNGKGTKNVIILHTLRTHQKFQVFFYLLKIFWVIFHFVIIHGQYMNLKFLQEIRKKITS